MKANSCITSPPPRDGVHAIVKLYFLWRSKKTFTGDYRDAGLPLCGPRASEDPHERRSNDSKEHFFYSADVQG